MIPTPIEIVPDKRAIDLTPQYQVMRKAKALEDLISGIAVSHEEKQEPRKIIQMIQLNQKVKNLYPASFDAAYFAAQEYGKHVLFIDTTDYAEALTSVTGKKPAYETNKHRAQITPITQINGTTLSILRLPKRVDGQILDAEIVKSILDDLRVQFDQIFIHSASPLKSPENINYAISADGVVLVLEAERARKPVVNEVKHKLETAGARILGTVLDNRKLYIPHFIYKRLFTS